MSAATHRAMFVLDVCAVDDDAAREIVDRAATSAKVDPGILALEASVPVRRGPHHVDIVDQRVEISGAEARLCAEGIDAAITLLEATGNMTGNGMRDDTRELMQQMRDRLLVAAAEIEAPMLVLEPVAGEVYPLHRGSRA